jgi:hypothetical protein
MELIYFLGAMVLMGAIVPFVMIRLFEKNKEHNVAH